MSSLSVSATLKTLFFFESTETEKFCYVENYFRRLRFYVRSFILWSLVYYTLFRSIVFNLGMNTRLFFLIELFLFTSLLGSSIFIVSLDTISTVLTAFLITLSTLSRFGVRVTVVNYFPSLLK